jgi:hypothetical protein
VKRRVGVILLLLVAGAIVNVAVAWGWAWLIVPKYDATRSAHRRLPTGNDWIMFRLDTWGMTKVVSWIPAGHYSPPILPLNVPRCEPEGLLANWSRIRSPMLPQDSAITFRNLGPIGQTVCGPSQVIVDQAYGIPCRAMACGWGTADVFAYTPFPTPVGPMVDGFELTPPNVLGAHGRAIPTKIIWGGLAINTLFYAGILWLLFAAPFALRRRRRIKRGLCPACAYPVGESDVCTECGQPLI